MSRKGPLIEMKAAGVACREILDFEEECGQDGRMHYITSSSQGIFGSEPGLFPFEGLPEEIKTERVNLFILLN